MKLIKLTQSKFAIVDDEDFSYLNQFKWHFSRGKWGGYAMRRKEGRSILMHRVIMDTPEEMEVDHINGNDIDNRKGNLRNCTHQENNMNRSIAKNNTSGFKGVSLANIHGWVRWVAHIKKNGKLKTLGYFKTKEEASECYNNAAKELFGEFAKLNGGGY